MSDTLIRTYVRCSGTSEDGEYRCHETVAAENVFCAHHAETEWGEYEKLLPALNRLREELPQGRTFTAAEAVERTGLGRGAVDVILDGFVHITGELSVDGDRYCRVEP